MLQEGQQGQNSLKIAKRKKFAGETLQLPLQAYKNKKGRGGGGGGWPTHPTFFPPPRALNLPVQPCPDTRRCPEPAVLPQPCPASQCRRLPRCYPVPFPVFISAVTRATLRIIRAEPPQSSCLSRDWALTTRVRAPSSHCLSLSHTSVPSVSAYWSPASVSDHISSLRLSVQGPF